MTLFKVRRNILIVGGDIQLGSDIHVKRVLNKGVGLTQTSTGFQVGGTPFLVPAGTVSPTVDTDGHLSYYVKAGTPFLAMRQAGGTPITMAFPTAAGGTPVFYYNSTP